jgi:hypothetical protein
LLNWWFDNKAPKRYGGIITNDFAVLVEQDLGGQTLDVTLANTESEAEEFTIALQSVEFIEEFHRICQEHYTAFYRTCYSTDLDRLTRKTYLRRARIALGRLLLLGHFLKEKISIEGIQRLSASQLEALAIEHFGDEFFAWYIDKIATPLVHAPRQILHNSLSPFHLVWNDSLYLIDFETMSVGAAQIDLAEFLGAPEINLSCEKQLTLVERYYELRGNAKQQEWSAFVANYYNALVSRNLDYLGTTAFRYIKYAALGEEERAFLQLNRARQYQSRVLEAVKAGHGNTLPCDIPQV